MNGDVRLAGPQAGPASGGTARHLVMFLHGYGADGNDLISLSQPFASVVPDAAFVAPNAPARCAAQPFGYQWYDVWQQDRAERLAEIRSATAILDDFITSQLAAHGLGEENLLLVGFSQGTMMSLFVGPRRAKAVAGILGYSGRLEGADLLADEIRSKPPVTLVHGADDPLVHVSETEKAAAILRQCGIVTDTHVRPGLGHGIDEEGIGIGLEFAAQTLGS